MIAVRAQPLGDNSSLQWIDRACTFDCFGLINPTFDSTNAVSVVSISSSVRKPTRVDRGFEFAMKHYENLLRRLAD